MTVTNDQLLTKIEFLTEQFGHMIKLLEDLLNVSDPEQQAKKIMPVMMHTRDGIVVRYQVEEDVWLINRLDKDGLLRDRLLDDHGTIFRASLDEAGNPVKTERLDGIPVL